MFKEHDLDWQSSARRLADVMQTFYDSQRELKSGLESLRKNTCYSETIEPLDDGNFLRSIRCDDGSNEGRQTIRVFITKDSKTYPGEYFLAPKNVVAGFRATFYKTLLNGWITTDIFECDVNATNNNPTREYKYRIGTRITDPIQATQVLLPKLKVFFGK